MHQPNNFPGDLDPTACPLELVSSYLFSSPEHMEALLQLITTQRGEEFSLGVEVGFLHYQTGADEAPDYSEEIREMLDATVHRRAGAEYGELLASLISRRNPTTLQKLQEAGL